VRCAKKLRVHWLTLWTTIGFWACNERTPDLNETKVPIPLLQPNIILFYVDDLGYGDLSCYGATEIHTPHIDRLAQKGLRFTDAHSSSATCTPSRYSLLTGNYAFRNKNAEILPGDAPLLVDTAQSTLPKLLRQVGYRTGIVGKWHLGLGTGELDWNAPISPNANDIGFDYSFLIPATGDRVPTVFVENGSVVNLDPKDTLTIDYQNFIGKRPTGLTDPNLLRQGADTEHSGTIINGISRIGYMSGGHSAEWKDEDFPAIFNEKSRSFMEVDKTSPFFLMYSFHDIHVPRVPHANFVGKSTLGPRGDAILQVDDVIGAFLDYLVDAELEENTLIIFTSDNGPVLDDGYADRAVDELGRHTPWGPFRGGKYSVYEAGTRVPTILYWPGRIEPGTSPALLNQLDLYASLAYSFGQERPKDVLDSENHWQAWLGKTMTGRESMLEEAFTLGYRHRNWKYIRPLPKDHPLPNWIEEIKGIESGVGYHPQLYNLSDDLGEQNNLAKEHPDLVESMEMQIQEILKEKTEPE